MNYNYVYGNHQEECSSGCESGWTVYLDHSSMSAPDDGYGVDGKTKRMMKNGEVEEDEDEDLSMVSDASSGPPQQYLHEEEGYTSNGCHSFPIDDTPLYTNISSRNNKKKKIENRCRVVVKGQDHSSNLLDDTASSPFLGFSSNKTRSQPALVKNVMEYSQGYSTTQFGPVRQPYQKHYEFFHSENQMQQDQWFEGKGW